MKYSSSAKANCKMQNLSALSLKPSLKLCKTVLSLFSVFLRVHRQWYGRLLSKLVSLHSGKMFPENSFYALCREVIRY